MLDRIWRRRVRAAAVPRVARVAPPPLPHVPRAGGRVPGGGRLSHRGDNLHPGQVGPNKSWKTIHWFSQSQRRSLLGRFQPGEGQVGP